MSDFDDFHKKFVEHLVKSTGIPKEVITLDRKPGDARGTYSYCAAKYHVLRHKAILSYFWHGLKKYREEFLKKVGEEEV